jgi:ribonuclease R
VGELTGRSYRLGDRLQVVVARVNLEDRKIDFDLVGSDAEKSAAKTRGKRGKGKVGHKGSASGHLRSSKKGSASGHLRSGKKGKKEKKVTKADRDPDG